MPADEVSGIPGLYTLPLEQFTAARDALAKRLASEGEDEEAVRVGKMRKPSVPAWALNRASRSHPETVQRLVKSHRLLRGAGSSQAVEEASQLRRSAVAELTEAAMAELAADGRPGSLQTRDRVNRTLLAAATDAVGEADLLAGTLVRELEPTGSGWGEMELPPPPAPDPAQEAAAEAERARKVAEKLEIEASQAEAEMEAAKQRLAEARRRAKSARSAADRAAKEAAKAENSARDPTAE
jgi:hypothetical protein